MSDPSPFSTRLNQLRSMKLPKGDFSVKIIMVGDAGVGKTSITIRFVENKFITNYISTLGVNIMRKSQKLGPETVVNWIIWDLGGQESFENYRMRFYGGTAAAFLIFDKTNPQSIHTLETKWLKEMQSARIDIKKLPVVVVANKIDLIDQVKVSNQDISALAGKFGFDFAETSAKTGTNIEEAFQLLAYKYLQTI